MKKINLKWQKEALLKSAKAIATSAETYVIFALVLLLWRFAAGMKFELHNIDPFSTPTFFERSFYSAITFFTTGRILYKLGFYKLLWELIQDWRDYVAIKGIIWVILMGISYEYIVPWAFDILNGISSLLFNIANFALYMTPPIGIAAILSAIYFIYKPDPVVLDVRMEPDQEGLPIPIPLPSEVPVNTDIYND